VASRFAGRLVLITGASAGIGLAAVREFVAEGARVVAVSRSRDRLDALAAELGLDRVVPISADVADGASMEAMARAVLEGPGTPDVVVANAGIGLDARFEDTSDDAMREVLEVNVLGVLRTVRPFVQPMAARGSGRIVFVSSVVGKRGVPHYSAYSGSKFALHGMSESLRAELAGSGVTVGVLCPSSTVTEFQQRIRREGPPQNKTRLRRHSAERVAHALVSLAASRRRERVLSVEGKAMAFLNVTAPWLLDFVLGRVFMRRRA
jgi:short-subunit dehydrogenase